MVTGPTGVGRHDRRVLPSDQSDATSHVSGEISKVIIEYYDCVKCFLKLINVELSYKNVRWEGEEKEKGKRVNKAITAEFRET